MSPEDKQKLEEVHQWYKDMQASHSIPLSTDQAIRARFLNPLMGQADKAYNSETRTVDEGGISVYNVLKEPDGFDVRNDEGVNKYYPWYRKT